MKKLITQFTNIWKIITSWFSKEEVEKTIEEVDPNQIRIESFEKSFNVSHGRIKDIMDTHQQSGISIDEHESNLKSQLIKSAIAYNKAYGVVTHYDPDIVEIHNDRVSKLPDDTPLSETMNEATRKASADLDYQNYKLISKGMIDRVFKKNKKIRL